MAKLSYASSSNIVSSGFGPFLRTVGRPSAREKRTLQMAIIWHLTDYYKRMKIIHPIENTIENCLVIFFKTKVRICIQKTKLHKMNEQKTSLAYQLYMAISLT